MARVPAAVERSVPNPAEVISPAQAASAGVTAKPAAAATAATQPAQSPAGAFDSLRSVVASFLDGSLSWLNGLPANPVTDFLAGAMLLVRRDVEDAVANPNQIPLGLVSNVSTNQTFVVNTLADSGAGSLRQAITDANAATGADRITFAVAGTIVVGNTALPTVTGSAVIDGTTAPGYGVSPVVRIDFQNNDGLMIAAGASGSEIYGLSLVDAAGAGVTIAASNTTLAGNYIGLWGNGTTVEGNRGDGVLVLAGANQNLIGFNRQDSFTLSNVIGGNRGNGITIEGDANTVQSNYIGTSSSGSFAIGNHGNGIQITAGAADNLIGGTKATDNKPTPPNAVIIRPPQGNLISGNCGNGVLIDNGATGNQLSGNFIGTDVTGNTALGNRRDGVAIVNADGNKLVGTDATLNPFNYYNVLSGNGGNGLRITDSNETTVWANFFGIGADNTTAVANRGDGMLVNGDSLGVKAGGPIPLGNVMAGNRGFGIEIADRAGGVLLWNEFTGLAAFGRAVPNGAGGIRVTSSNPNFNPDNRVRDGMFEPTNPSNSNEIRTCLVGGNRGNGIEFLGDAQGAQVTATAVGTDETIAIKVPNTGDGILIGGNSSNIFIGGFAPSIEYLLSDGFGVHVGASYGWGINIEGNAHDITVVNTRVGLGAGIRNEFPLPNGRGGIKVGPGASNITIGGPKGFPDPLQPFNNEIALNDGPGMLIWSARNVTVRGVGIKNNLGDGIYAVGDLNGTTVESSTISDNSRSGVVLRWARGITVGAARTSDFNEITDNGGWGIFARGWSRGSALTGNIVTGNSLGQVDTTLSTLPKITINEIFDSKADVVGTLVTGVRGAGGNNVVLTATGVPTNPDPNAPEPQALLFVGPLDSATTATPYFLTPPFDVVTKASFYGPNTHWFNPRSIPEGFVKAVGSYVGYRDGQPYAPDQGMVYLGPPSGGGTWTKLDVPTSGVDVVGGVSACQGRSPKCSVAGTIPHSTMGDLIVGNYDLTLDGNAQDPTTVNAFIYNTATKKFTLLGSNGDPFGALNRYTTIYGVWQNGGQDSPLYTLAGGTGQPGVDAGQKAFLVTYNASTGQFGTPSYYTYPSGNAGLNTHFEGVTQVFGGFTVAGEAISSGGTTTFAAFIPTFVPFLPFLRNVDTVRYGSADWAPVAVNSSPKLCPAVSGGCELTSANTIYENNLMGIFIADGQPKPIPQSYLATITGPFGLLPWWYL